MMLAEFLAWEERQTVRLEFDGFAPVAMIGGTRARSAIQRNLITALHTRLRASQCEVHGSGLEIIAGHRIQYPDALVSCTAQRADSAADEAHGVAFEDAPAA